MSKWWAHCAYLFYVCVFVVVGLEVLLRLFPDPEYYSDDRFLFVSPRAFENRASGVWTYRPHADIREAAVYALPAASVFGTRLVLEYDCRMRSNNLGLLQADDIEPGAPVTVVVGDSLTAGQGGCPWFHRLQALRPGEKLVNGGLLGTGIEQWRRLIVHLKERGVNVRRVLAIAISNDFKRVVWNWRADQLACLDGAACPSDMDSGLWLPLANDESHAQLLERSAVRLAQRFPNPTAGAAVKRFLRYYSYLYKFGDNANETIKAMIRGCRDCALERLNDKGLKGLKALGVPLHFIMVPQRNETGLWWDQPDTEMAVDSLKRFAVPHSDCELTAADFLKVDGHPTKEGYDKIAACAHAALNCMDAGRP